MHFCNFAAVGRGSGGWLEGSLMEKKQSIFRGRRFGVLEIGIRNFTSRLLFDLLLSYRLKDVSLALFDLRFQLISFYQTFFVMVFYFIKSLSKSKSVQKLIKESIKMSKVSYFSVSFKLNKKNKVPLKYMICRGEVTRNFLLEEGLIFNRGLEIIQKKGRLYKKGVERKQGGRDPRRNYGHTFTSPKSRKTFSDFQKKSSQKFQNQSVAEI